MSGSAQFALKSSVLAQPVEKENVGAKPVSTGSSKLARFRMAVPVASTTPIPAIASPVEPVEPVEPVAAVAAVAAVETPAVEEPVA